jgi:hypothetical protein
MTRSLPTGAWIAGGLVTAALLVPGVTYAAATMTEIVGANNKPVKVSKESQLYVAPADAANDVMLTDGVVGSVPTGCYDINTLSSSGSAAVLTGFRASVAAGSAATDEVDLYVGANCEGAFVADFTGQTGGFAQTISPGVPVPAGTHLSVKVTNPSGTLSAKFFTDGYTVPNTAFARPANVHQGTLRRVG